MRSPRATASVRAVRASSPATSRSWLPATGYHGAPVPGERKARWAAASSPGWRGGATAGGEEAGGGGAGACPPPQPPAPPSGGGGPPPRGRPPPAPSLAPAV